MSINLLKNSAHRNKYIYHGDSEWGYPNGIPASVGTIIKITNDFNDELELQYQTPDPNNRWDEF